jgi:hypothetical protein
MAKLLNLVFSFKNAIKQKKPLFQEAFLPKNEADFVTTVVVL